MVAPVIGGVLTDYVGWRSVFLFTGCFGLAVLALVWLTLMESRKPVDDENEAGRATGMATLFRQPLFVSYALQCGFSMGIFFAFIASAPYIVVNLLGYSATVYGFGFVVVSIGLRRW